ncbi:replicative DNA helicase [Candidatus Poribacteria bacterium]|nr:replicative DNA helicase [Candidatus Poribacteria bacterium]
MATDAMPHDLDAERHVLGSLLLDPDAIHAVLPVLGELTTVFYKVAHQVIYDAILRLSRRSDPIDLYTVTNELKRSDDLERAGSVRYLYEVQESTPSAANVEFYATIVREKSVRRELVDAAAKIGSRAVRDDATVEEVVDQAQRLIFDVNHDPARRGFADMDQMLRETMDYIESLYQRKGTLLGVPTGLPEMDRLLSGLNPSDLIVLAARPSMGKSALAHNIAGHIAFRESKSVALFTLEMDREQILTRMLATEARIDMQRVRTGALNTDDWRRLSEAAGKMEHGKLFVNDAPGITLMEIRAESRRLKMRHPDLCVLIIDYMQLMQGGAKTAQSREQEISEYSRSLKELARELEVSVLALSQLNRAVESRPDKRPQLADLRESGAIEQDADIVMFLYRDEYYNPDASNAGQAELIVRKHRNGPLGTITLAFHPQYLLFRSYEDVKTDYS